MLWIPHQVRNDMLAISFPLFMQNSIVQNPFAPELKTHKLKGKLSGAWACSVSYDLRLIFDFVKNEKQEDDIFLIEIGSHDEVY